MSLDIRIRHSFGDFRLEAEFSTGPGITAIFGPSGAGKTTIVNIIAGLVRPESGRVAVDGRVLVNTEARLFVPPHRRRIGYVFQEARLFPHMNVRRNLLFGRLFTPAAERWADLDHVVDLLGIGHLLGRRPRGLSGGERQRVAIGRAIMASPRALLMDEPLASLDEARKAEILPFIRRLATGLAIPVVYVSHSAAEVEALADQVILIENGRVGRGSTVAMAAYGDRHYPRYQGRHI